LVRIEDEHSRWDLPGERDSTGSLTSAGHLVTDEAIRTYGRQHVEREILAGLLRKLVLSLADDKSSGTTGQ